MLLFTLTVSSLLYLLVWCAGGYIAYKQYQMMLMAYMLDPIHNKKPSIQMNLPGFVIAIGCAGFLLSAIILGIIGIFGQA